MRSSETRHELAVDVLGPLVDADVVPETLGHLLDAVEPFQDGHGQRDLRLLAHGPLEIAPHQEIEGLVGAAQLHVGSQGHRIVGLGDGIQELVQG